MTKRFHRKHLLRTAFVALLASTAIAAPAQAASPTGSPGGTSGMTGSEPPSASPSAAGDTKPLSSADRKFVMEAANSGLAEVELGQLASQKATDPAVKEFAERMVRDHGNANSELEQATSPKGIQLPKEPDDKHRRKLASLQDKSGTDFDKAYMKLMVDEHQKDVRSFEQQAKKASDAQLKAFAEKKLPALREHLQLAKDTESAVKDRAKSVNK